MNLKTLYVPEHLICIISGDLMDDPVTIASGCTFERQFIEQHFEVQRAKAQKAIRELDSDNEEEVKISESDFMTCPKTMKIVDPEVMVPNISIIQATERFIYENKWAYLWDPTQKYEDIQIWN